MYSLETKRSHNTCAGARKFNKGGESAPGGSAVTLGNLNRSQIQRGDLWLRFQRTPRQPFPGHKGFA